MATERRKLGKIYQHHYKTGIGAEIGCLKGEFSKFLSTQYKGIVLSIDSFVGEANIPNDPLTEDECRKNLAGTNCWLIKGDSIEVASGMPDEILDWVYIDADHRYKAVKADLEAWFPKVRKGGIISGHDYTKHGRFGVVKAVDEFCDKHKYKIEKFFDYGKYASWYLKKWIK